MKRTIDAMWTFLLLAGGAAAVLILEANQGSYGRSVLYFVGITMILTVSLTVTNGFSGLFSLGHPAFMAVGAYTAAILTYVPLRKATMLPALPEVLAQVQWPLVPATLAGGVAATLFAIVVGIPVIRLRGHYLSLATLGLIIIVQNLIVNLRGLTRGPLGINGIAPYTDGWHVFGWLFITVLAAYRLRHSRYGRALLALREDEVGARVLGIPAARYKLFALCFGAFFAGVAGALWAHLVSSVTPASFSVGYAFQLVAMVVIGGSGSISGALVAAGVLGLLAELLRPIETAYQIYGLTQLATAALLIVSLIVRPQGLFGHEELSWRTLLRRGQAVDRVTEETR